MNEAVIKDEVIEEEFNFTFVNGEYVEVKQEEIEQKPEHLLENEVKTETIDFAENVELKPKEIDSKVETGSTEVIYLECEICQKMMPRNLLKMIKSEDYKVVLAEVFKIEGSLKIKFPYVCVSHIQTIIDDYDGKLKSASTPSEKRLRSFIRINKANMKQKKSKRRFCKVCHIAREEPDFYDCKSNGFRIVLIIGCILRGSHSVEQAISVLKNHHAITCHSHCKESIDRIFEHLGIRSVLELSWCSKQAMTGLMNIVKDMDSNFTTYQFIDACRRLFCKSQKFDKNS
ncbi:unnamed protein product [Caenorhabditis nigoni]